MLFLMTSIQSMTLLLHVGLEPNLVHRQPGPDAVFPEHSARVGALCLSMVAGAFLLPSPLLP